MTENERMAVVETHVKNIKETQDKTIGYMIKFDEKLDRITERWSEKCDYRHDKIMKSSNIKWIFGIYLSLIMVVGGSVGTLFWKYNELSLAFQKLLNVIGITL